MSMPGEHRHAQQVAGAPVVALPVNDAMAVALQKINDRLHRMAMAERTPVLTLFGVRRDDIVPKPVRMIVRAEASVNDIDMFVLAQFLFDLRPFEQHVLSFAPALLVFGEAHAMHQQFCMYFLDRFDFHEFLPAKIRRSVKLNARPRIMAATLSQGYPLSKQFMLLCRRNAARSPRTCFMSLRSPAAKENGERFLALLGMTQSNSRARAASEIATTAGCLSLRSSEIAKNCSRTALVLPIILTLYWRRTSALITDGAKNNPSPRWPNTCSRALSSHSATMTGRIFSVSNHWSRERRTAVLDVGNKKGAPSRH